jgi:hypothetical protein
MFPHSVLKLTLPNPRPGPELIACLVVLLQGTVAFGQGMRPLTTESADTLEWGRGDIEIGIGTFQTRVLGQRGQLWEIPQLAARVGLGPTAELRLQGNGLLDFDPDSGDDAREPGDFTFWAKVRFWKGTGFQPVVAGRIGVKLPVTSNESGLGTDETDFLAQLILSQKVSRSRLHLNLGLAVLGDPTRTSAQSDAFTYALAAGVPLGGRARLVGEIAGQQGPGRFFDRSFVRAGVRWEAAGAVWDTGVSAGLIDESEDWGIVAGMTRGFSWTPKEAAPSR